jgi:thiamine biosynthesis lipoprotein
MATRFEIVLHGEDPISLRAAGEEALDEVERLENQLSLYRPTSEIAHLNARAAREPVRVEPGLFALLQHAKCLHQETGGAFDITIAPLVRCWGFMGGGGRVPGASELAAARAKVGMHLVQLDPENYSVRFHREGMMLDLGAIGKGYAIERAAVLLREAGVARGILHGGTSTVYAIGSPPDAQTWNVAIEYPEESRTDFRPVPKRNKAASSFHATPNTVPNAPQGSPPLLAIVPLKDEALSVSAVWGKSFQSDDKTYGHVLDPRTGRPVSRALMAAVVLNSATETDALSTALLTVGIQGHDDIGKLRPAMRSCVIESTKAKGSFKTRSRGIAIRDGARQNRSGPEKQR